MKAHPFHLVDNSPWPFFCSFGLLCLTLSAVFFMHRYIYSEYFLLFSVLYVIFIASLWWRDVIREALFEGQHTKEVKSGLKYGMILFIISEVLFFIGFFWAFFSSAISPTVFIGAIWPPVGLHLFNPLEVPLLNTVILLTSGITVTIVHYSIYFSTKKHKRQCILFLYLTILLGIVFTFFQGVEYFESSFSINSGIYGSVFFMLTGLHGLHVIIGTIFLFICLIRMLKNHFTSQDHLGLECAIWYWHFVDVVWIFVYLFIYSHCFLFPIY